MTVKTWDPFEALDDLRREIERAFDGYASWRRPFSRFSFLPAQGARTYPLLNVAEDENNVYIEALAPGLDPDSLDISVQNNQIRIAGEKTVINPDIKAEAYHRNERGTGRFVRTMSLPAEIDAEKVKAEYKKGLLQLVLPKSEKAKPKQINVEVA
ncbi:MAG: Hsp20/alpha crystallin family protein [Candidatus Hydrogenedentes bacterium]|nr:Hsp20/alpha crystallin family protein [Candidatus Hydrogenedentota bacterium]